METNRRERYERPAYAHTSPADLLWLALGAIAVGALIYVLFWPQALNAPAPDYRPDPPRAAAPVQAAPIPQPPVVVLQPAPDAPAPVVPTAAPAPPVEPGQPAPAPQPVVIVQRVDGRGGQVITGAGACAVNSRVARRCGR